VKSDDQGAAASEGSGILSLNGKLSTGKKDTTQAQAVSKDKGPIVKQESAKFYAVYSRHLKLACNWIWVS
jgi:hypothetical protein